MILSLIGYDVAGAWSKSLDCVDDLAAWKNPAGVTWINVEGLDNMDEINKLAEIYQIHPLTVEDILDTTHQRPKVEDFDTYMFIALKAVDVSGGIELEHIGLVITKDTVITFQEKPGDSWDGIRKRILNNAGRVRRMGPDYLAYAIMDSIVDEYFISINLLGAEIEEYEDKAADERDNVFIQEIQVLKRKLLRMWRVVWPLRESLSLLTRIDSDLISDDLGPFLKDLYDHIIQATETVETYRELISGIMEINMSIASNSLNKVIKVLTIISTIFIPLTFIAGIYGMNFNFMPELDFAPAYFIVLGVMAIVALGMLLFFKRRKWI